MKTRELNQQELQQTNGGAIGPDNARLKVNNSAAARVSSQDDDGESQDVRFADNTGADFSTED